MLLRNAVLLAILASCSPPTVDDSSVDTPDDPVVVHSSDDTVDDPSSQDDTDVDDDTDCHAVFGSGSNPCDTLLDTDTIDTDVQDDTDVPDDSDTPDTDLQETGIPYCYDQVPGDECFCDTHPTDPWCLPPDTDVPADSDDTVDSDTVETDTPPDSDTPADTDVPFDERCPPPTEAYEWVRGGDLFCYCSFNPGSAACVCPSRPADDPWCATEGWPW